MEKNIQKTKTWILNSGIFISDNSNKNCGAVHSFFDKEKNEFGFLYPEITGYFLSSLRFLHEQKNETIYLDYGQMSANWLLSLFEKYGSIIQGIHSSEPSSLTYSFDTAICAKGILDYFLLSKDQKFLNFGQQLVSELNSYVNDDGTLFPLKNLQTHQFEIDNKMWYKQKGCLHIKCAIPFFQLFQITNNKELFEQGCKISDTFSKFQNSDGSLSLHLEKNTINLHTLCYALEGLLYAYYVTKNDDYLSASHNALEWIGKQIENDGSIQLWFNSKYKEKAVYPIAQYIRLIILLNSIESTPLIKHLSQLTQFLISNQDDATTISTSGGFCEGYRKSLLGWKQITRINSWTSLFSLQSLIWSEQYQNKSFEELIEFLY